MTNMVPSLPNGFLLHRFGSVGSTNDEAKALGRAGAPGGILVWAREQTSGRGRRGRAWLSPPGNLYLSLLVRPECPPAQAAQLGFVTALALGDALHPLAPGLRYKWPNDLLLNGRKLAGILLESEMAANGAIEFVVIGVGVNLASTPAATEFPATSLFDEGVADITAPVLIEAFAQRFADWLRRWRAEGFAPVRAAWLARAGGIGEAILVRLERSVLSGRFIDLDEDGALVLEAADGRRRITAGEVFPATA